MEKRQGQLDYCLCLGFMRSSLRFAHLHFVRLYKASLSCLRYQVTCDEDGKRSGPGARKSPCAKALWAIREKVTHARGRFTSIFAGYSMFEDSCVTSSAPPGVGCLLRAPCNTLRSCCGLEFPSTYLDNLFLQLDVGGAVGEGILSVVRNHPTWPQPYT